MRSLRAGCYLLRYTPGPLSVPDLHYDGTLRVERAGSNIISSGDLYLHRLATWPADEAPLRGGRPTLLTDANREPDPSAGIPIFPIAQYRYYLEINQILEGTTQEDHFVLGFEMHRFDHASHEWTNKGEFTAELQWVTAPAGFPSAADFLLGQVKNSQGSNVGTLSVGWVSPFLRRAVIEIDRVAVSETPLDNGLSANWRSVFADVGWDMTVIESESNLTEPSGISWSDAECHATMLEKRGSADLDTQWHYHLLCVRRLDSTERGIMYDAYAGDSNNIPREGVSISSHWVMPNTDEWGRVRGQRFGATPTVYFRTAVHELGHAMGLYHNTADNGFMNTTDVISASAVFPVQFPDNIKWSYANDDQKRLRHLPDIHVRPGGTPFGSEFENTPISPDDAIEDAVGLKLEVTPLLRAVPLGAPVRINFTLTNSTKRPLPVPASLSMKSGFVRGFVTDPSGTRNPFVPLLMCVDSEELKYLKPGESISDSATLLRGSNGSLFPANGVYKVVIEVSWHMEGSVYRVTGQTSVMVTPPQDSDHADAALTVISTPDALLTLVLGGDHLPEGVAAIKAGLDNKVLHPHFAIIEAKRLGQAFRKREANLEAATKLITADAVLSAPEVKKAADLVQRCKAAAPASDQTRVVTALKKKVNELHADSATMRVVSEL